jgi:hypothetical protein
LSVALDSLAGFCDDIYVLDDRSTDGSADVLRRHPSVTNVIHARADLPADPWLVPESVGLELLYRMADFCQPEWVAMIDHDQMFETQQDIRYALSATPADVVGLMCRLRSSWEDTDFPQMVPLMGTATGTRLPFWRYFPGLRASRKPLHNLQWPANLADFGRLEDLADVGIVHSGWDTLAKRIARVRTYQALDPNGEHNFGKAYDRSLLFGYALDDLDGLKVEYRRRLQAERELIRAVE